MAKYELNYTTGAIASGLGGLLSGVRARKADELAEKQLQNQTQETAWKNPYRAASELDRLKETQNPLYQAIAQLVGSYPPPIQPSSEPTIDVPVGANGGQPQFLTPQQKAQQATNSMTAQNSAPVPIQKFDWMTATADDFLGYQAEAKRRASSKRTV